MALDHKKLHPVKGIRQLQTFINVKDWEPGYRVAVTILLLPVKVSV